MNLLVSEILDKVSKLNLLCVRMWKKNVTSFLKKECLMAKRGLYSNIHAKRKRIKAGSGERMRKPGSKGAPTNKAFKQSAKTAKKRKR